jgi:SAM-dependent methyltransferase
MHWKYKALLQLAFSNIPRGEYVGYFFQRYVTRNLPATAASFIMTVAFAQRHIGALQRYYQRPLREATFYEYGAGWDMAVPLAFYAFGVERQLLVDIRRLLRIELVNDTIEKFQQIPLNLALPRTPGRYIDGGRSNSLALLKEYYGIDYRAPCDARHTGLEAGAIDCITSTSTLEHIPLQDIRAILRECHRLLQDDGVMSFLIDYQDHYSYFDRGISGYNFLRYSDKAWTFFSPTLHYQNRLRHRDYLGLFREAGFEIVEERLREGTEADLKAIEQLPLAKRFRTYSLPELAVRNALITVRKNGFKIMSSEPDGEPSDGSSPHRS